MVSQGNFSSCVFVAAKWQSNGLRSATVRPVLIADGVHKCEAAISVGVAGYTMGFYVRHALGVMSMGLYLSSSLRRYCSSAGRWHKRALVVEEEPYATTNVVGVGVAAVLEGELR